MAISSRLSPRIPICCEIVDEAHAFDAYMSEELATLLAIHAAAGSLAIVVSATTPQDKRAALAATFVRGLGSEAGPVRADAYPLLTTVSAGGATEATVDPFPASVRRVAVERVPDPAAAVAAARDAAARGAAVLWVRNSVDEAIKAAETLRAIGATIEFFHARFAMCDRLAIEAQVLARFGRDATSEERAARILVATQLAEQSLDLDFDLVISDLAPVEPFRVAAAATLFRRSPRTRE
jgi:CRISPR-associated endonuclease/helicase Cas3